MRKIEIIVGGHVHKDKKVPPGTVLRVRESIARRLVNLRLGREVEAEEPTQNNNNKGE